MLNAQVIGSFISKQRKELDLTQVELADKVNVSHQAVSKWERGESLPDIGTLMELAKLFKTSVDHLLNGGNQTGSLKNVGKIVEAMADHQPEKTAELLNSGEAEAEAFVNVASITKTSTLKGVTDHLTSPIFTLDQLIELAPFLDEASLASLFEKMDISDLEWDHIVVLAPFLPSDWIAHFVQSTETIPQLNHLVSIAPFVRSGLDRLIAKAELETIRWDEVVSLAPFIKSPTLQKLIDNLELATLTIEQVLSVAPFLDALDSLMERLDKNAVNLKSLVDLAPFVKRHKLGQLIEALDLKEISLSYIIELAPFLERERLDQLVERVDMTSINSKAITEIAPFVNKTTLSYLIDTLTK